MKAVAMLSLLLVGLACGGSQTAAPAPTSPAAIPEPAQPKPHVTVAFETPEEWLAGMKTALANDDRETVADLFAFPIGTLKYLDAYARALGKELGDLDVELDRAAFLKHYDVFITDDVKKTVAGESLMNDPDGDEEHESKIVRFERTEDAVFWWIIRKQDDGAWRIVYSSMVRD